MNTQTALRTFLSVGLSVGLSLRMHRAICGGIALLTCACIARGPDDYRMVTRGLVDTKQSEIEGCFGGKAGKVVINFTVEKKTGKIANPIVDDKASTAPAEVGQCVATKIDGLGIDRPDMRDGAASFTWEAK